MMPALHYQFKLNPERQDHAVAIQFFQEMEQEYGRGATTVGVLKAIEALMRERSDSKRMLDQQEQILMLIEQLRAKGVTVQMGEGDKPPEVQLTEEFAANLLAQKKTFKRRDGS